MQTKKLVSMSSRTGRDLQRYNVEGCRQVVGCIPYRFKKNYNASSLHGTLINELEFLLISSQKSPRLMFPKGGWELDETIEEAAIRETIEEAGVLGVVESKLGVWTFKSKSQDTFHEGHMLTFRVSEELDCWPEKDVRQRVWLTAEAARSVCTHEWMKEALDCFLEKEISGRLRNQEPPRTGRLALNGQEEEVNCSVLIRSLCLPLSPCSTEESRIGRVTQGEEVVISLPC
ncbi:hypothetical protein ACH5RR_024832 [Cinchona calisaya]|uniref:Nudix hydrolase domain-containing protein n=1 Tax=Cinchona calisaya TaxID=153742 RepID=A0ABD2Z1A0_9GENT